MDLKTGNLHFRWAGKTLRRTTASMMLLFWLMLIAPAGIASADHLTLNVSGKQVELDGEILIEAQDKSLYFRQNTGKIWFVKPDQIVAKVDDDIATAPISKDELGKQLLTELPEGFRIYQTEHYVIAYQNEVDFARWIGGLYESRLYHAFEKFWEKRKKFELDEPQYPMAAIVFGSRGQYNQHVQRELGPNQSAIAYYNIQTNRITMFDLTADQRRPNQGNRSDRQISEILRNPAAVRMVATIIHEATHQLIFNRGLQTRFAESPLWLNEGLAMYFEAPNLNARRGWTGPGQIFDERLIQFRNDLPHRDGAKSIRSLVSSDQRLRDQETVASAYAEAWALTHFLLNRKSDKFVEYLKVMATKKALVEDTPEKRLEDFCQFFGEDLEQIDDEFIRYIGKLKYQSVRR